jgi:hypothetical protein
MHKNTNENSLGQNIYFEVNYKEENGGRYCHQIIIFFYLKNACLLRILSSKISNLAIFQLKIKNSKNGTFWHFGVLKRYQMAPL